ncbi:MAG: ABC transporter ATP-binding protein [Gemella sp.]|nr:ABC transporter ATP-binding protein [Gemella sp.]
MSIIRVESLTKQYGKKTVLDKISFEIERNTITAIIGKSGSGKSTILNIIGMLEEYQGGSVEVEGKKLPKINSNQAMKLRRERINYLFQSAALIGDISVRENLLLAMNFEDLGKKEKNRRIEEVLKELEIDSLIDSYVNTLSGGEAQRVAMARCILKQGDIILADEPTGSLDVVTRDKVFEILTRLRDKYNKTIVMVTHDVKLAKSSDRIININHL